ncbi:hypothetical protein CRUP_005870 [Coryphaenoides rupestris]|nr:hypothetical protein CRUP_005870 [Coryphaenoides rupestris]
MAFSFLCHTAILPIYCELDRPSKKRMQKVANMGLSLSILIYLISAIVFLRFPSGHVESELLQSYDAYIPHDVMVMIVRLTIQCSVLFAVPLIHFPARKALTLMLFEGRPFSLAIHVLSTVGILSVVLLMAVFVPDIRNMFGIVGSTTSTCLMFVFPGIFYLKISTQPLSSPESIGQYDNTIS